MEDTGQLKRAVIDASSGAISGGLSRTVTSPLDVIKIRFQVQLEPTSSWALLQGQFYGTSKYTGVLQATKDIFREEGLPGFWRGNVPALLMVMPYAAIQFTVLHKVKTFAAGSSKSGTAATVGSYPFDLLRTVLASQGKPKVYSTMRSAFIDIVRTRGISGLYAGLSPTLVEIIPYAGLQFGTYDTFKRWIMEKTNDAPCVWTKICSIFLLDIPSLNLLSCETWNQYECSQPNSNRINDAPSSFQLFLCGLAASTSSKAVCHPLDVVKKRFQIEGLQRHPKYGARVENWAYKSMWHALRRIADAEGWAGLYKGIFPSIIKAAPAGAVTFVAYEYISNRLESSLA